MGVPGPPWKVSKESNDIRHVRYQFYSVFSTENESRVDKYLRFQIRLPQGGPGASRVQGPGSPLVVPNKYKGGTWGYQGPLGRSPKNLMI